MALGVQGRQGHHLSIHFFATAGAIARMGATPVFVDIDPCTFNLDPAALEAAVSPATRGIIPVHLFGQMAEMEVVMALAGSINSGY
jgi:dTDP-4-amino-4,6-dideoxygalactose transaminase